MYEAMIIFVGKDMATGNYVKSYADINLEEDTEMQSIQLKMKGDMKKLQKVKRHFPLVHKKGNIGREIECMKMMVLKSCLKRLEM
jgi:hypothetical protein